MEGTIRTFDAGVREELHAKLRKTVNMIAEAAGASAEITISGSVPVTGNDPELLSRMLPSLAWAAGADQVVEHRLITGAEDYSWFQERIPGLFLMLGINKAGVAAGQAPANHSPLFDANEDALIVGVRAHVGFVLDYPAQP